MSVLNTRLDALRSKSPNLDQWTLVPSRYGAFDVFRGGQDEPNSIISQQLLAEAASAVGRDVTVPVFDAETVTVGSTRSVTIADSENTTQRYTVSFTIYSFGFTQVDSLFMNNEIAINEDYTRKFNKYMYQLASDLEDACLSSLDTNKNQVFAENLGYTETSNVLISALADEDEFIGDLVPVMNANDFYGPYYMIGNVGMQSRLRKLAEQGLYNDKNKTIQYSGYDIRFTNALANGAGNKAAGYLVNQGSVGLVFRHEREALLGTLMKDGTEWGVDTFPMLNIPMDTYYYESRGDFNAIAGAASADMTRAAKKHFGFAIEVATVTAYNQDLTTYSNPIMKFAISST